MTGAHIGAWAEAVASEAHDYLVGLGAEALSDGRYRVPIPGHRLRFRVRVEVLGSGVTAVAVDRHPVVLPEAHQRWFAENLWPLARSTVTRRVPALPGPGSLTFGMFRTADAVAVLRLWVPKEAAWLACYARAALEAR